MIANECEKRQPLPIIIHRERDNTKKSVRLNDPCWGQLWMPASADMTNEGFSGILESDTSSFSLEMPVD